MKKATLTACILILLCACRSGPFFSGNSRGISLSGTWNFRIDSLDVGIAERWFEASGGHRISIPGSMAENGFGDGISMHTPWTGQIVDSSWFTDPRYERYRRPGRIKIPFWLQPGRHYTGPAWYGRTFLVPSSWKTKTVILSLERCHWETRVWVDGRSVGMQNSLSTPHQYNLGNLTPGKHRIAVRIDNRIVINVGMNAHSVSDHTQTNWNGMIGSIILMASDPVRIGDVRVDPDVTNAEARLTVIVLNASGSPASGRLTVTCESFNAGKKHSPEPKRMEFSCDGDRDTLRTDFSMGSDILLWDEYSPALYRMKVEIEGGTFRDERPVTFGMRKIGIEGTQFTVNGRKTFLRGTLECCIFPMTGYPPTRPGPWMRILKIAKSHGLNHIRFHSWCPPEAAFEAADRMGFLLQVECGFWTDVGEGGEVDRFIREESGRILRTFGNHPSFAFMAHGNEPGGGHQREFLGRLVSEWKATDPRRLYTSASGWPMIPENDFHSSPDPRMQAWGAGLTSIINSRPPQSTFDYGEFIRNAGKPVVSHEIGQWCVFPNFDEISRYRGVLKAKNFEFFRETLEENGLGGLAGDFLLASGKLQALCYKADIEAALRTPGMAGFQLLDLHDFPGQGTALVGVLDAFWNEKGYIRPEQYRRFCGETVPLARLNRFVFFNRDTLVADIEAAHFGPVPMNGVMPEWTVRDRSGKKVVSGFLRSQDIPVGNGNRLGRIVLPLARFTGPEQLSLEVTLGKSANSWNVWVYPASPPEPDTTRFLLVHELDSAAVRCLEDGGRVFLAIPKGSVSDDKGRRIGIGFSPIFWNTAWTGGQKPHTLGILCDPDHPAFSEYPTDFHSDTQWWDACSHSQPMILEDFPDGFTPIVRVIDDWFENRNLALVFEARVLAGTILVSSIDFVKDMDLRQPAGRQLFHSLKKYIAGNRFHPHSEIGIETLKSMLRKPSPMLTAKILRRDSEVPGYEAGCAIDDDPSTFWHTPWQGEVPRYPHEIVIDLGQERILTGFELLPRQDRIPGGMIFEADFFVSKDGRIWGPPVAKALFARDGEAKTVNLREPRQARFLKLIARKGFEGQEFASLAELKILLP